MDRIPVSSFPAGLEMTQGCGPFVSFLSFLEGRAHQEDAGQSYDSVKLREYGKDQSLAEYVVTLSDTCNTVSTNLTLTDSREQTYDTQCQTAAEYGCCLQSCDIRGKNSGHIGKDKVTCKTVQTLCTGQSGEHDKVTELVNLLQCTYSSVSGYGYAVCTTDACKADHKGYAHKC